MSPYKISRRTFLGAASLAPLAAHLRLAAPAFAETDPAVVGSWTQPFDMGGVAIHATLCHNDDVLIFQYVEGKATVDHTSWVGTWNWRTGVTAEAPFSYHRDIFCAGHNVLADGRVFIAGGHDHTTGKKQDGVGVAETDIYDPVTRTWTPTPLLTEKRWYPTNVGLPNGKTLIFGGQAQSGAPSNSVDEYDAITNTMRQMPPTATKPLGVYPRLHLIPNGKILRSGPDRMSLWFDPVAATWTNLTPMLFGGRTRGGAFLLPGARKVMNVGGGKAGTPTATAEMLDTSQSAPKWRYTGSLNFARMLHNSVVLPDGTVLIVGGGLQYKYTNPIMTPELYNPATETWSLMAPQQASRMYHSTALLLPDGRVLSAGQDNGPLAKFGEIYSPPYLFRGPRPVVTNSSTQVATGGQLRFDSVDAADLTKVVLIRPGSSTHEIDTDQRSVPLSFQVAGTTVTAQVPANVNEVPPGYWLLFALNSAGVPAVAPWIKVV
jgi:hypothetical protein